MTGKTFGDLDDLLNGSPMLAFAWHQGIARLKRYPDGSIYIVI